MNSIGISNLIDVLPDADAAILEHFHDKGIVEVVHGTQGNKRYYWKDHPDVIAWQAAHPQWNNLYRNNS